MVILWKILLIDQWNEKILRWIRERKKRCDLMYSWTTNKLFALTRVRLWLWIWIDSWAIHKFPTHIYTHTPSAPIYWLSFRMFVKDLRHTHNFNYRCVPIASRDADPLICSCVSCVFVLASLGMCVCILVGARVIAFHKCRAKFFNKFIWST